MRSHQNNQNNWRLSAYVSIFVLGLTAVNIVLPPFQNLVHAQSSVTISPEQLQIQIDQLYKQGKYREAIPLAQKLLDIKKRQFGNDHPDVATSLNDLAELYYAQGRYEEAEPLYLQALEFRKKLLGRDHPSVATSLNNLALLYDAQGRYKEAEPLYLQALELRKKLLGNDHPYVATSLNNLAALYDNQGRYEEAEPLFLRKFSKTAGDDLRS